MRWRGAGFSSRVTELRARWRDAERGDPGPLIWAVQDIVDDDTLRLNFDRCAALGVDQVVLDLQAAEGGHLLPLLDRYAAVLKTSGA